MVPFTLKNVWLTFWYFLCSWILSTSFIVWGTPAGLTGVWSAASPRHCNHLLFCLSVPPPLFISFFRAPIISFSSRWCLRWRSVGFSVWGRTWGTWLWVRIPHRVRRSRSRLIVWWSRWRPGGAAWTLRCLRTISCRWRCWGVLITMPWWTYVWPDLTWRVGAFWRLGTYWWSR